MSPRRILAASTAVIAAVLLVACNATTAPTTPSPTSSPAASASQALTPVPGGSGAASPAGSSAVTQTDTEWGRIWDELPPSFPLPPDAVPTETGEEGPASGSFAIGAAAPNAASLMETALTGAGFSFESTEGPLEDGSFTLNAVGRDPACMVQVRVRPLSGTTNVVVLYGAGCPFE